MKIKTKSVNATFLVALFLSGCGGMNVEEYLPDKKVEYKRTTEVGNDLELPPDLTNVRVGSELYVPDTASSGVATYSEFLGEKNLTGRSLKSQTVVLPDVDSIELKRDGSERWLVIQSPPQSVWQSVANYWQENGILLTEQDPTVGIMKTGWMENRADIGEDIITNFLKDYVGGLYDAATRDQFRIRLEAGTEPGTTELYLTHFGLQQTGVVSAGQSDAETFIWEPRPRDISLEAEMLRRIMVYLGVEEQRANNLVAKKSSTKANRSELIRNPRDVRLLISESFSRSWRLTGLALDRVGFAVEDRDRSAGVYYVRYNDPLANVETDEGWLSKLKFWGDGDEDIADERFQVQVQPTSSVTEVVVLDEQGQRLLTDTAGRILNLIHEQIK